MKTSLPFVLFAVITSTVACATSEGEEAVSETSDELRFGHRAVGPLLPSPDLKVPAGNELAGARDASGVQNYVCTVSAESKYSWVLFGPQANLFGRYGALAGTHFAGPTWQSNDGSAVKAARVAGFTVTATAVPALLLNVTAHSGPSGELSAITFIQRLNTTGGVAPADGCDAQHAGAIAAVPYTATYYFYRAVRGE